MSAVTVPCLKTVFYSPPPHLLAPGLVLLFWDVLWPWGGEMDERCPFGAKHSADTCQHSDQLCAVVIRADHCKEKLPWKGWGYKHKNLEGNLTAYKTAIVGSSWRPVTSWTMDFWPGLQHQAWIPSCEACLKPNPKGVSYLYDLHAVLGTTGTLLPVGQYCSMQH